MTEVAAVEAYAGQLSEAAQKATTLAEVQRQYINGNDQTDIYTETGPVPTLAKQARLGQEKVTAALSDVASQMAGAMVFDDTAIGLVKTQSGGYFSVPSAENTEYLILYKNAAGFAQRVKSYPAVEAITEINEKIEEIEVSESPNVAFAVQDEMGRAALSVADDGTVDAQKLRAQEVEVSLPQSAPVFSVEDDSGNAAISVDANGKAIIPNLQVSALSLAVAEMTSAPFPQIAWGISDEDGNTVAGFYEDGTPFGFGASSSASAEPWQYLSLGLDDAIAHIGDSYGGAHYVLPDKAYISQLAQLSPFRHVNFAVSGNDLLDMQYRAINGASSTGSTLAAMKVRYAFLTSFTNDAAFRNVDRSFYAENYRRLVDTVRGLGIEPIITTEFPAGSIDNALLSALADEMGCAFVDCSSIDAEVGGLKPGPFQEVSGHPGTRTGGVFWQPMLDFIDRLPRPEQAIKIYRKRSTFSAGQAADLLYKDRLDRAEKWKELSIYHYALSTPERFEELNQLGVSGVDWGYVVKADEYLRLQNGSAVSFTDFGLIELTLPGDAASLSTVEISLGLTGTPSVFARDNLDVDASMPGKIQGSTPTEATYLSKWNKPRGAWRLLGAASSVISLTGSELSRSMVGRTLTLMVQGAFTLSSLSVRYKGRTRINDIAVRRRRNVIGNNLLATSVCGNAQQLAGWTVRGAPKTLVPIDLVNAPRAPGGTAPVDGVVTITADDNIGQTVNLPADGGRKRRYRLTVWARYFPKAYLDPARYPDLDAEQIIDRMTSVEPAPITSDTLDLRTVKCEMWTGSAYPTAGGMEQTTFASLQYRALEFEYEALPYRTGQTLSFNLSCLNGSVQVAKADFVEIETWA